MSSGNNEFGRDEKSADYLLPDSVKNWFQLMYTHMIAGNVDEMNRLYNKEFNALTNNYFKQSSWPEPSSIAQLVDSDNVFLTLYTQIYFRHYHSKLQPTMEFKQESYQNYCKLFDGILDGSLELDSLPSQWTYDIIGEFVYQYQSFSQHRAKVGGKSETEVARFSQYENIWETKVVLQYLERIIDFSKVKQVLTEQKNSVEKDKQTAPPSNTILELGCYALICLSRANVLYGDYYTSLQLLEPIKLTQKGIYSRSCACQVSLFYHMGFAQLMLQRFGDAIQSLSTIILQVHRHRSFFSRQAQYDQVNKWVDKSLALLAVAITLCPGQRMDDQLFGLIREKHSEQFARLQKGETAAFLELFTYASPKFILPSCPIGDEPKNRGQESLGLQTKMFKAMVERHTHISTIRSYLKLYRAIDTTKLASFRDSDEDTIRSELISYKKMNYQQRSNWSEDSLHEGKLTSVSDIQFMLRDDLVEVKETKVTNQNATGDYFMKSILKFNDLVESLE